MRIRATFSLLVLLFAFPFSAHAFTYIQWTTFGSTYQSASFSFITEPIVVSSSDIRKMAYSTLPLCQTLKEMGLPEIDCIKSIEASTNGKNWLIGTSTSYIQIRQQPINSPGNLVPEWARSDIDLEPGVLEKSVVGSRSSLWTFPGLAHKNGNEFLVSYQIGTPVYNDKLNYKESFTEIEIQPVAISITGTPPSINDNPTFSSGWSDGVQCFRSNKMSYCLTFHPFDTTELRFRLKLNLTNASESLKSDTWMFTHSFAPHLEQTQIPGSKVAQEIVFELSPTAIQTPTIVLDSETLVKEYVDSVLPFPQNSDASELVKKSYEETKKWMLESYLKGLRENNNSFSLGSTYLMGRQDKYMNPKNTSEYIGLRVQTLPLGSAGAAGELFRTLESCPSTFGVAGVISTNATAVETTPPTLDKQSQTLKYRVAAPHLKQNGEINSGFYRLQLNPQVAKCIWGDNLLGAKAEVSLISDNGETQITASTFEYNDKAAIFEISGFHYSAGSINIKLSVPDKTSSSTAPATAAPKITPPAKSKLLSITCIKGKLVKKITAAKPKCPAGYTKK